VKAAAASNLGARIWTGLLIVLGLCIIGTLAGVIVVVLIAPDIRG
jgi:hypothetical protein